MVKLMMISMKQMIKIKQIMMMMKITDRIFQALCNFFPKTLQDGSMGLHATHQPDHYDDDDDDEGHDDDEDEDDDQYDPCMFLANQNQSC